MAKCMNCGASFEDNAEFCPTCGQNVTEQTVSVDRVETPPVEDHAELSFSFNEAEPKKSGKAKITVFVVIALAVVAAIVVGVILFLGGKDDATEPKEDQIVAASAQTIVGRWKVETQVIPFAKEVIKVAEAQGETVPAEATMVLTIVEQWFGEYVNDYTISFYAEMDADGKARLTITPEELDTILEDLLTRVQTYVADGELDQLLKTADVSEEEISQLIAEYSAQAGYELDISYADLKVLIAEGALQEVGDLIVVAAEVAAMSENYYEDGCFCTPTVAYECADGKLSFDLDMDGEVDKDNYIGVTIVNDTKLELDLTNFTPDGVTDENITGIQSLLKLVTVTRQQETTATTTAAA